MDPVSITAACVSLTATITKTSVSVTGFVRSVRAARSDLDTVSRELASLKTLLELIAEDAEDVDNFPETLCKHITGILANCELVLVEVQRLVDKYSAPGIIKGSKWALAGSEDVTKLKLSLEAHKSALEIALEMVTLSVTKQIKADTGEIRDDTAAIKQDTTDILQEIARLRAQLPDDPATLRPTFQEPDTNLARYLDDLTSYAETVCWSGEDSDTDDEKTAYAGKSMPTSTPSPSQKLKNAQDPIGNSTKEFNFQAFHELKPQIAGKVGPDELASQPSPPPANAEVLSVEHPQVPEAVQTFPLSGTLQHETDRRLPDATVRNLRTSSETPQNTEEIQQPLNSGIQRKSLPPVSQPSYHLTSALYSSPRKPKEHPREAQATHIAVTHRDSSQGSSSDNESQEPPKTKVPPTFTKHITDLESRLVRLRLQSSYLEDQLKVHSFLNGESRSKTWYEEKLAETRRNEKEIGWKLHQAKREGEKKDLTPVSDPWFQIVTELENVTKSHASDVRPQIASDQTQRSGNDWGNDEDRSQSVNRESSSSTEQRSLGTSKTNPTSPISQRSISNVRTRQSGVTDMKKYPAAERAMNTTSVSDVASHSAWRSGFSCSKSGSYCAVGEKIETHQVVCVKKLMRDKASNDVHITRELEVNSILWHRNIMDIYACIQSDSQYYLKIPFEEQCLAAEIALRGAPLQPNLARKFAEQIGIAIAYCHAHRINHLDLDLSKVFLVSSDTVKVAGFGQLVTVTGQLLAPGFITVLNVRRRFRTDPHNLPSPAPELLTSTRESDTTDWRKVDVWSFGIIIWMMLMKQVPTKSALSKSSWRKILLTSERETTSQRLLAAMLKESPQYRMNIEEVNCDPWMTCDGLNSPIKNFIPIREPLTLPLNTAVGPKIRELNLVRGWLRRDPNDCLTSLILSRQYQEAIARWREIQKGPDSILLPTVSTTPKRGLFGLKTREIINTAPIPVNKNFFSVLSLFDSYGDAALYYLVQEKLQRNTEAQERVKVEHS